MKSPWEEKKSNGKTLKATKTSWKEKSDRKTLKVMKAMREQKKVVEHKKNGEP